jgi:hypothetical protein
MHIVMRATFCVYLRAATVPTVNSAIACTLPDARPLACSTTHMTHCRPMLLHLQAVLRLSLYACCGSRLDCGKQTHGPWPHVTSCHLLHPSVLSMSTSCTAGLCCESTLHAHAAVHDPLNTENARTCSRLSCQQHCAPRNFALLDHIEDDACCLQEPT